MVVTCCVATTPECPPPPTVESAPKITNAVRSLRMPMVVLFDGANISFVGYRLMIPKADGSANHFDTKILVEHVTQESAT